MSKEISFDASRTDRQRLRALRDEDIDFSDLPEASPEEMGRGQLRFGGKAIPPGTVLVPLDVELVERFKARADAEDYQTLINAALRAAI